MASEDAVVSQGLECCLCFELFTEPKQLSCTHTFCKKCLDRLYECHLQPNQLSCPMCRQVTTVKNGDISKLQPNIAISSMVEDVKSAKRSCTVCDPKAISLAVQYCMHCVEYLCDACSVAHGKYKKTAKHVVVSVDDVNKGKVKVKFFCNKHPEEEKLYVCTSCNVSICSRCHVIDHSKPDHAIKEVSDFQKILKDHIISLQDKATAKLATIEARAEVVKEQKAVVKVEFDQRMAEINKTYEEAEQHLRRQRNDLIDQCKQEKETLLEQLEEIKELDDKRMSCIRSATELVGNGIKTLLEGQSLAVHRRISGELQKMLDDSDPDTKPPKSVADRAKGYKFFQRDLPKLGDLRQMSSTFDSKIKVSFDKSDVSRDQTNWKLKEVVGFRFSRGNPADAVLLSDGRVAVGFNSGEAVELFTVDGPQSTVLEGVEVFSVSVLSGGRFIVQDSDKNLSLYTTAWERLHVQFNTLSYKDYRRGGMCVDRDDNIYVGYGGVNKIIVFRPEGGAPLREIPCHECQPCRIVHMNHSKRLVVCDGNHLIMIIDEQGKAEHCVNFDGMYTNIVVLNDDSILIGYWHEMQWRVKLYTEDLKRIRMVFSSGSRYFCGTHVALLELPTGEIVDLTEDYFIVLRRV